MSKVKRLLILFFVFVLIGCATTGVKETSKEPIHAEAGVGITLWKIPILGIGGWSTDTGQVSSIIVHRYDYQAQPPVLPEGTPYSTPTVPPAVDYKTLYPVTPFDDPTLTIFINSSERITFRVAIDHHEPFVLTPGQSAANIHLDIGEHIVEITGEVQTRFGPREIPKTVQMIQVRARDYSKIIYLH